MEYPIPSTSQVQAVVTAGLELDSYRGVEQVPIMVIHRFTETLYHNGFILTDFKWWDESDWAKKFMDSEALLDDLTLLDLVKLLSLHARADRFCENHFEGMVFEGHIQNIVQRLGKFT